MTTAFLRAATAPHDDAATVTTALIVDTVSGPHTIVALGEDWSLAGVAAASLR